VDELDAGKFVEVDGTLGERAQPFEIFGGELVAGPESGEAGDGVEFVEVHEAADGFVVIAADEDVSERLRFGNDFVGVATVADGVAEIDDEVVGGSGGQTGVQRFEVAVNVAEKEDAHGKGRIIAFLGRKRRGEGRRVPQVRGINPRCHPERSEGPMYSPAQCIGLSPRSR